MTRFDNLDLFLRQQEALISEASKAVIGNIEASKAELEALIRDSFHVLDDYYRTILQPRTDFVIVPKKKEQPNIDPSKLGRDHYVYMVNFIPKNERPYRDNNDVSQTYWQQDKFDFNDWHPNVALQFQLCLQDKYSSELKANIGLKPMIYIKSWGRIPVQEDSQTSQNLYLGHDSGWNRTYAYFTIYGNQDQPQETQQNIQAALTLSTPNVLNHKKNVRGY